jgi:hypothetical protein
LETTPHNQNRQIAVHNLSRTTQGVPSSTMRQTRRARPGSEAQDEPRRHVDDLSDPGILVLRDRVSNQGIPRGSHYMPGCQYKKTLKFPMPSWRICFSYSLSLYENWFLHARNPQEWHRIHYISRQDVFVKQLACSS